MALSAVATTSWSSTTMKAAVAVRARTQRWVALDVMDTVPPLRVCTGTDRPGVENSSLGGDEFPDADGSVFVTTSRRRDGHGDGRGIRGALPDDTGGGG